VVRDPTIERAVRLIAEITGVDHQPREERAIIQRLAHADVSIDAARSTGRLDASRAIRSAREAHLLHRLLVNRRRSAQAGSLDAALATAARDLCDEFGFDRSMTFAVGAGVLDPVETQFVERDEWAARVHACALSAPPQLDLAVYESAVVDGRRTIMVEDAQTDPGSWKPVVVPLLTRSYVVAPIVVDGRTVGTIHADRWFQGIDVDRSDRDLIGLVGAELSRRLQGERRRQNAPLTKRQVQVMELIAAGHTNASIAAALHISPETVKSHVTRIFQVLGVSTRAEAVGQVHNLDGPSKMVMPDR
jgi:DNA-binding CsgD family transcriptional regulator